jgi:competence protein ComGC
MALPGNIVQQMLAAAETQAGAHWGVVASDIEAFAADIAAQSATIAQAVAGGQIDEQDAKMEFDLVRDQCAMEKDYVTAAAKIAAQNAINAALGVLWSAILAGKPGL